MKNKHESCPKTKVSISYFKLISQALHNVISLIRMSLVVNYTIKRRQKEKEKISIVIDRALTATMWHSLRPFFQHTIPLHVYVCVQVLHLQCRFLIRIYCRAILHEFIERRKNIIKKVQTFHFLALLTKTVCSHSLIEYTCFFSTTLCVFVCWTLK